MISHLRRLALAAVLLALPSCSLVVASEEPTKRADLIDKLLYSPEFVDRWVLWFGDLVGNVSTNTFFHSCPLAE